MKAAPPLLLMDRVSFVESTNVPSVLAFLHNENGRRSYHIRRSTGRRIYNVRSSPVLQIDREKETYREEWGVRRVVPLRL